MVEQISYNNGEKVCLGDIVEMDGRKGRIVACIACGRYSPGYPEADWSYLKVGVLWESAELGLVHIPSLSEPDVVFIQRKHEDAE
jgi:hypothetical protein